MQQTLNTKSKQKVEYYRFEQFENGGIEIWKVGKPEGVNCEFSNIYSLPQENLNL